MIIPLDTDVYCHAEICGSSVAVVLNPLTDVVTHIVVKEKGLLSPQWLIPIDALQESSNRGIHLKPSVEKIQDFDPFFEFEYIQAPIPHYASTFNTYYMEPWVMLDDDTVAVKHRRIPQNELSIRRGARVYSVDDQYIGHVDEFIIHQKDDGVSHLVLREGHLWGQKDVFIPVSKIKQLGEAKVILKLDNKEIAELPALSVRRKWS
jgi:uncharacterized protein YrrD